MAKFVVLCLGLLAAALSVKALTKEELDHIKEATLMHFNECNKDFNVSEDDIKAAETQKNMDKIDACLIGCMMKRSHLLDGEGKFDTEKAIELSKSFMKSEDDQKKFAEVVAECAKVNDEPVSDGANGCERSKMVLVCLAKHKAEFVPARR
ncbi:hypothetical protein evm_008381 [Chilo suppressalis]|uniref:Odorant binding protein n=1 Tax=Chilo suppressalis TaxID=168631 RepID=X2CDC8_CHISP|nr:odorant binding protein [Chilo suppressalis]RVE46997.1 hypothetical protein evm_008381 [Chilo suppressalis]